MTTVIYSHTEVLMKVTDTIETIQHVIFELEKNEMCSSFFYEQLAFFQTIHRLLISKPNTIQLEQIDCDRLHDCILDSITNARNEGRSKDAKDYMALIREISSQLQLNSKTKNHATNISKR